MPDPPAAPAPEAPTVSSARHGLQNVGLHPPLAEAPLDVPMLNRCQLIRVALSDRPGGRKENYELISADERCVLLCWCEVQVVLFVVVVSDGDSMML